MIAPHVKRLPQAPERFLPAFQVVTERQSLSHQETDSTSGTRSFAVFNLPDESADEPTPFSLKLQPSKTCVQVQVRHVMPSCRHLSMLPRLSLSPLPSGICSTDHLFAVERTTRAAVSYVARRLISITRPQSPIFAPLHNAPCRPTLELPYEATRYRYCTTRLIFVYLGCGAEPR